MLAIGKRGDSHVNMRFARRFGRGEQNVKSAPEGTRHDLPFQPAKPTLRGG